MLCEDGFEFAKSIDRNTYPLFSNEAISPFQQNESGVILTPFKQNYSTMNYFLSILNLSSILHVCLCVGHVLCVADMNMHAEIRGGFRTDFSFHSGSGNQIQVTRLLRQGI